MAGWLSSALDNNSHTRAPIDFERQEMQLSELRLKEPRKVSIDDLISVYSDPYSDTTKKNRRNLLVTSVVSILYGSLNIVPSAIPSIGVDSLPNAAVSTVPLILLLGTFFFFVAFLFHAVSNWYWNRIRKQIYLDEIAYDRDVSEFRFQVELVDTVMRMESQTEVKAPKHQALPEPLLRRYDELSTGGKRGGDQVHRGAAGIISVFSVFIDLLIPALVGVWAIILLAPHVL